MTESSLTVNADQTKGLRQASERKDKTSSLGKNHAESDSWSAAPPSYATIDKDTTTRKAGHRHSHRRTRRSPRSSSSGSSHREHGSRHRRRRGSPSSESSSSSFDKHEAKRRVKRASKDLKRRVKRHLHDSSSSSTSDSSDNEHRNRHRDQRDLGTNGSCSRSFDKHEVKRRVKVAGKNFKGRVKRHVRDSSTSSSSSSSSSTSDSDHGHGRGGHHGRQRGWKKLNWPFSGRK